MSEKKMCEMCGNWNDMGHQTFKQQEAAERLNCVVGRKKNTETDENGDSFQIGMQCVYRKEVGRNNGELFSCCNNNNNISYMSARCPSYFE